MDKNKFTFEKLPFLPRIWSTLVYLLLIFLVLYLFLGRVYDGWRIQLLMETFPDFYGHVSNFSISFMLCLVAGYVGILLTGNMKSTIIIMGLLLLANFIYEWFVPVLNTPDRIDAYYGFAGTVIPWIYFYFYQRFGLKKNPDFNPET